MAWALWKNMSTQDSKHLPDDVARLSLGNEVESASSRLSGESSLTLRVSPSTSPRPKSPRYRLTPPSATTVLDENGDLLLEIGPSRKPFLVDSHSLVRASSVWHAKLHGDNARPRRIIGATFDWIVQLPEDTVHAMTVLLRLLHGDIVKNPEVDKFDDLFDLVTSAARYDLVHLLRPWAEGWTRDLKEQSFNHFVRGELEEHPHNFNLFRKQLTMAWDLGNDSLFNSMVKHILLELEINDDGDILDPTGQPLKSDPRLLEIGLLDALHSRRNQLIRSILQPVDQVLDKLLRSQGPKHYCVAPDKAFENYSPNTAEKCRSDCSMVMLGSLVRGLTEVLLFPIPDSGDIFESIDSLAHKLLGVLKAVSPIQDLGGIHLSGGRYLRSDRSDLHSACNPLPAIIKEIESAVGGEAKKSILTEAQTRHMFSQGVKSGIIDETTSSAEPSLPTDA